MLKITTKASTLKEMLNFFLKEAPPDTDPAFINDLTTAFYAGAGAHAALTNRATDTEDENEALNNLTILNRELEIYIDAAILANKSGVH